MLVFNNDEHFCKIMENGFEKYPNKRDLMILCEKWLENGAEFADLKGKMVEFCIKWNSQFNYAKSENLLLRVLKALEEKQCSENGFKFEKNIKIYQNELDEIQKLPTYKMQKVAFVMICLAKWRNVNFLYFNNQNSLKLKDVFSLANVKCTGKEQNLYLYDLKCADFIDIQMRPLLKCFYPCICDSGEGVIQFEIDENLLRHWENYALPHCVKCGKPFEKGSNRQKYCKICAKKVKNEQNRGYILQKGN